MLEEIKIIFYQSKKRYGSPRIAKELEILGFKASKQLVRKLTEANSQYDITGAVISIQPGVMDDFAIRGLYKTVPYITAIRTLKFTATHNGKVVGTMNYVQELKIDVN